MRSLRRALGLGLFMAMSFEGCREAPPGPDVVAEIGDQEIHFADFQDYLEANAGEPEGDLDDEVSSALLDGFLEECLLSRWAVAEGLVSAGSTRRAGVDAISAQLAKTEASGHQIQSYYDEHRDDLYRPERVHLQQMLLADRVVAEEVRAEWNAGIPFLELVALYSSEGLMLGADEGDLAREDLPLIFADAIFSLRPGQVSEVFAAEYGFHLFKVADRWPAGVPELERVEEEVRRELLRHEVASGLRSLVVNARQRYNVRVFERNLPFEYTGEY